MNHIDEHYKHQSIDELKAYIETFYPDCYIFFLTYTFRNSFLNLDPYIPLYNLFQNLKNASVSKASKRNKSIQLICFSEASHDTKISKMKRPSHFHCFLILPKTYKRRFYKKAIKCFFMQFDERLQKKVPKLYLHRNLYKRIPNSNESKIKPMLLNYNIDVKLLLKAEDVSKTLDYSTKHICAYKHSASITEIEKFELGQLKQKQYTSIADDRDFFYIFGKMHCPVGDLASC